MVNVRLPLAVYGKPSASDDAGGYRFLIRHPAFDRPVIDRALRRLIAALEWKPSPHRHSPVFGLLGEGDSTLVARFVDAGRDASGRPHALRVECVLLDQRELPGALLCEEVWAGLPAGSHDVVTLHLPNPDGATLEAIEERILLIGDENQFARSASTVVRFLKDFPQDGNSP
jgi:hypothetical protein